jgi:hypothetical protein
MTKTNKPEWFQNLPLEFRNKYEFMSINTWKLIPSAEGIRALYVKRFGTERSDRRIKITNRYMLPESP